MTYLKKILLTVVGIIVFYFCTVLTLFLLGLIFNISYENLWFLALPVTFLAFALFIVFSWKDFKIA